MARKYWRLVGYCAFGLMVLLVVTLAAVFQDGIARFFATPRAPFQTVEPPAAPDYESPAAWLLRPTGRGSADKPADVFYVHSTTYYRRRLWNAPIDDEEADKTRRMVAAPNEAGPFADAGEIYAPRYREATLYSLFTHKYDGLAARELAYSDVKRGFQSFLKSRDPARPLFLVGYGQGGLYALGLLHDFFQGEANPLRRRLVAAYLIGSPTPVRSLDALRPPVPPCPGPLSVRCVISYVDLEPRFDEEMERVRRRSLDWDARGRLVSWPAAPLVCINPLSWRIDGGYQGRERHAGAASATGVLQGPPARIAKAVGARCENGVLIVDTPERRFLRRGDWFGAKWKAQPYNLFYYDLSADAHRRLGRLTEVLKTEPEPLPPIEHAVEVEKSPINKIPQ
jgi:hypothetical protein